MCVGVPPHTMTSRVWQYALPVSAHTYIYDLPLMTDSPHLLDAMQLARQPPSSSANTATFWTPCGCPHLQSR